MTPALSPHLRSKKLMNGPMEGDLDSVEQDSTLHYRVTETKQFLDRLLPADIRIVTAILQFMKDENLYDSQTQRWSGFPVPTHQENGFEKMKSNDSSLYGPFCAIAEAIRGFAETRARLSISEMGTTKWIKYHSKSPRSTNSQLRPGALFTLQAIAEHMGLNVSQVRKWF